MKIKYVDDGNGTSEGNASNRQCNHLVAKDTWEDGNVVCLIKNFLC